MKEEACSSQVLDLSSLGMSDDGAAALGNALVRPNVSHHLVRLFINHNRIGPFGAFRIAKGLVQYCHSCEYGPLSHGYHSEESCVPHLRHVDFSHNRLGNEGAMVLARQLVARHSSLNVLALDGNQIGNEGVICLFRALQQDHGAAPLKELRLRDNFIGTAGAVALSKVLETNTTLERVDLSRNNIGPNGYLALRHVLKHHNTTLQQLVLDDKVGGLCWEDLVVREEIQLYVDLNRAGRRSIPDVGLLSALWPKILASISCRPDLLYIFLSERPDLLCRS